MPLFSRPRRPLELQRGDHIWYHTHSGLVQHHGIYVGDDFVIHFDDKDTDKRYNHCGNCSQLLQRRPGGYVRKSCLTCWRLGDATTNIYTCEYDKSLRSLLVRETGSRSMERSHHGHLVAARAQWYFENDPSFGRRYLENDHSFGCWELFAHNCEDFARFCKILKLGSKQSTQGLLIIAVARGIVVRTVLGVTALMVLRTWWRAKLLRNLPPQLR